jgi:hypothetical protein
MSTWTTLESGVIYRDLREFIERVDGLRVLRRVNGADPRYTREQLYDLVWSEPMQRLAKQIGISDVAIAKHCRKLGVPVAERGYWNKLQVGSR